MEDAFLRKDEFAFERAAEMALDTCLETLYKLKRSRAEKNKRLATHLEKLDPRFASLFIDATVSSGKQKFHRVNAVLTYTEKILGGALPKEWKLKGALDLK